MRGGENGGGAGTRTAAALAQCLGRCLFLSNPPSCGWPRLMCPLPLPPRSSLPPPHIYTCSRMHSHARSLLTSHFPGSQAKANASAQTIICQVCRSTFVCTSSRASLTDHSSNKHAKQTFEHCFPGFTD